jgi:hypothetical protein
MSALTELTPEAFADRLREGGSSRAWIAFDPAGQTIHTSHPFLEDLGGFLDTPESGFAGHEGIFLSVGAESGALFGAFVYTTTRGMAQGGLRYVPYGSFGGFLRDGSRLSQAMARKSALAGLWWGGGKGIIARQPGDGWRDRSHRDLV